LNKQQVLFVETHGQILDGLRSRLAGAHPDWHILLVVDASAALELVRQRSISIVLANFGHDRSACEDFFRNIKDDAPEVIRMGLLDARYKETLGHSLEYVHECIASHCDPEQVEVVIGRGLSVWERTRKNPNLAALMSNLHTLPTPPALYLDIRDELDSPHSNAHSVAQIIARDPAITAKLLQVANSGFYATPRPISDLYETIILLGMDMVLVLVMSAHLFDQLPLPGLNLDFLWVHSIAVATLAKEIAIKEGGTRSTASACEIAGLLHDLGELIFFTNVPESYYAMVRRSGGDERVLLEMELEQFGVGHPELGAHILSLWGLPEDVVQAIAYHHGGNSQSFMDAPLPSKAVCIAESLLQSYNMEDELVLKRTCLEDYSSLDEEVFQGWKNILDRFIEQGLIHRPCDLANKLFG
jgi:putative nucleotidyltransferase with HDIG domain